MGLKPSGSASRKSGGSATIKPTSWPRQQPAGSTCRSTSCSSTCSTAAEQTGSPARWRRSSSAGFKPAPAQRKAGLPRSGSEPSLGSRGGSGPKELSEPDLPRLRCERMLQQCSPLRPATCCRCNRANGRPWHRSGVPSKTQGHQRRGCTILWCPGPGRHQARAKPSMVALLGNGSALVAAGGPETAPGP